MDFVKLGMMIMILFALGLQSCGDDKEGGDIEVCQNQNCDNPLPPAQNLIGTWRVFEEDEDGVRDKQTVTFNADGTGFADDDNDFTAFDGTNGELLTTFEWEYQIDEEWYLVDFGFFGRFYSILELDCDYMHLENNSTLTNTGEKLKVVMCRES